MSALAVEMEDRLYLARGLAVLRFTTLTASISTRDLQVVGSVLGISVTCVGRKQLLSVRCALAPIVPNIEMACFLYPNWMAACHAVSMTPAAPSHWSLVRSGNTPPELMTTYPINFIRAAKTKSTTLNTTAVPQAPSPPDVAPQVSFSPSSIPPPLDMPLNCAYSPISPYREEEAEEEESLIQLERDGEKSITQENSERLMIKKKTEVIRFNL